MRHRDCAGNEGLLCRRRRAVDDRRPRRHPQRDARAGRRRMEGFQLWLNLPAKRQDVRALVPRHPRGRDPASGTAEGVTVRVIAGAQPRRGRARCSARPPSRCTWTCTCRRAPRSRSRCRPTHNAFVYVYRGELADRRRRPCRGSAWPSWPTRRAATACACTAGAEGARAILRCRPAAERADRAVRALRDEQQRRDLPGGGGLPRRPAGLTARPHSTFTPFQNATRPLICAAASLGSG